MPTDSTALHRPMPGPTAQVEPYVEALGAETAVTFLPAFGGAELTIAEEPTERAAYVCLIGQDKAKALAAVAHRLPERVPLASKWLAAMLHWQGHTTAHIARTFARLRGIGSALARGIGKTMTQARGARQ